MAGGKIATALAGVSPLGWGQLAFGGLSLISSLRDRRQQKKAHEALLKSGGVQSVLGQGRRAAKKLKTDDFGTSLAVKRQQRMEAKKGLEGTEAAQRAAAKRLRGASAFGAGAERRELRRLQRQADTTDVEIMSDIDKAARLKAVKDRQFAIADRDRAIQMRAQLSASKAGIKSPLATVIGPVGETFKSMAASGEFDDAQERHKGRGDERAQRRADRVAAAEGYGLQDTGFIDPLFV